MSRSPRRRYCKGLLQSFEAIIAILMILTVFIMYYGPIQPLPEFRGINRKLRGFEALKALDNNNELRSYAIANDTKSIESKLYNLLPRNLNYEVFVCEANCGYPNIASESLVSVVYVLAGNISSFKPVQVVLYMWD